MSVCSIPDCFWRKFLKVLVEDDQRHFMEIGYSCSDYIGSFLKMARIIRKHMIDASRPIRVFKACWRVNHCLDLDVAIAV